MSDWKTLMPEPENPQPLQTPDLRLITAVEGTASAAGLGTAGLYVFVRHNWSTIENNLTHYLSFDTTSSADSSIQQNPAPRVGFATMQAKRTLAEKPSLVAEVGGPLLIGVVAFTACANAVRLAKHRRNIKPILERRDRIAAAFALEMAPLVPETDEPPELAN
jgi:hypothetical protein